MELVDGPRPIVSNIFGYLLAWWTSTKGITLRGNLHLVIPGIVMWEVRKAYAAITFGEDSWARQHVCESICRSDWCSSLRSSKYAAYDSQLITCGLSPPLCVRRLRISRWLHPLVGRYKLNVDATHAHRSAAAGSVLRSSKSYVVGAIGFLYL